MQAGGGGCSSVKQIVTEVTGVRRGYVQHGARGAWNWRALAPGCCDGFVGGLRGMRWSLISCVVGGLMGKYSSGGWGIKSQ